MKKFAYFDTYWGKDWPDAEWLKPYFLNPPGRQWFQTGGNDSASLVIEGVEGTEKLEANRGRIDVKLSLWGNAELGVLLIYSKWGGGYRQTYSSRGDLTRLRELVRSLHDTPLPVGLFIPFDNAWRAVKEFMETDGALPKSIEWIANSDLHPNTFPDP